MAPIRWQGGDKAPSRKSSLLCRLILNWPDPLTGTGILKKRHTQTMTAKTGPLNDHIDRFDLAKNTEQPRVQIFVQRTIKASQDVLFYLTKSNQA